MLTFENVDWNEATIERLRALWHMEPRISTAEIGRRLNISKNAVIGKVGRMGWERPASPIGKSLAETFQGDRDAFAAGWLGGGRLADLARKHGLRDGEQVERLAAAMKLAPREKRSYGGGRWPEGGAASTLPPLASVVVPVAAPVDVPAVLPAGRRERAVVPAMPPAAVRVAPPRARRVGGKVGACQFPIGEPGSADFRFCDEPSEPGGPYCVEHHRRCYVPIRDIEARRAEL